MIVHIENSKELSETFLGLIVISKDAEYKLTYINPIISLHTSSKHLEFEIKPIISFALALKHQIESIFASSL